MSPSRGQPRYGPGLRTAATRRDSRRVCTAAAIDKFLRGIASACARARALTRAAAACGCLRAVHSPLDYTHLRLLLVNACWQAIVVINGMRMTGMD
ncbi:hypothetical protein niasHS_010441 [Heterodera schachtii]|uniref:Uncharacterized protein n=1 Tax=Heterodera schachtii TaxID=97005 RepID=A0ABD2IZR7_HETSC